MKRLYESVFLVGILGFIVLGFVWIYFLYSPHMEPDEVLGVKTPMVLDVLWFLSYTLSTMAWLFIFVTKYEIVKGTPQLPSWLFWFLLFFTLIAPVVREYAFHERVHGVLHYTWKASASRVFIEHYFGGMILLGWFFIDNLKKGGNLLNKTGIRSFDMFWYVLLMFFFDGVVRKFAYQLDPSGSFSGGFGWVEYTTLVYLGITFIARCTYQLWIGQYAGEEKQQTS